MVSFFGKFLVYHGHACFARSSRRVPGPRKAEGVFSSVVIWTTWSPWLTPRTAQHNPSNQHPPRELSIPLSLSTREWYGAREYDAGKAAQILCREPLHPPRDLSPPPSLSSDIVRTTRITLCSSIDMCARYPQNNPNPGLDPWPGSMIVRETGGGPTPVRGR